MKINFLIIHELKKEIQGRATLKLSKDTLNSIDKNAISLIEELNSRYRDNITYGVFVDRQDVEDSFQIQFDKYLKATKKNTKNVFIEMANKTIHMLHNRIDSIGLAKGGYLIYCDYLDEKGNHFFSVFLIRDKTGKTFKMGSTGVFTINEVIHVEIERLAMACRINMGSYKTYKPDDPGTYLGFVSIKQPETSDYFLEWIGAEKKKREKEDSTYLVKVINNMDPPYGPNGQPISRDEFRKNAYSAIISFGKNAININTLSSTLFGDEKKIKAYADANNFDLSTEFYPSKSIINNLDKYHVKADNIEMSFPPEYYEDKIWVDTKNPELTIIKSKQFADSVMSQGNVWKI